MLPVVSKSRRKDNHDDSTLEDWNDYMSAKKSKLQKQFQSEAQIDGVKNNIFSGTSIFVNGYSIPSADELRHLMMNYGGVYHHYYRNGQTTFMVASNLPYVKIQHYRNSSVKIIKPSWITDSIEAGKMLDFKPYLLLSDFAKDQGQLNFTKTVEVTRAGSSSNDEINGASESKREKILNPSPKRKTAVDDNFLDEFYSNSRLHHISTLSATFKQYINELRLKRSHRFAARERLRNFKSNNPNTEEYQPVQSCIMHIDMDCFFVSVGLRSRPELKELPVAVTHAKGNKVPNDHAEDRRAEFDLHKKRFQERFNDPDGSNYKPWFVDIGETDSMAEVASCNYAARKLGIKNGMLLGQAFKLCPDLKTIPYDFDGYKEVAYKLFGHVASYTLDIEAVSCDEMFVDCSSLLSYTGVNVLEFATILRKEIQEITGCTCSTGFGCNRLIARLATKKAKPDGQYFVRSEESKDFIREFNVSELPGVGRSISAKLANLNVHACKELQEIPVSMLQAEFGNKMGQNLHRFGEDDRALNFSHQRKSISAEVNYGIRFQRKEEADLFLKKLAVEVKNRLNNVKMKGKAITLKLMIKAENAPKETAKFLGHGICDYITKTVSLSYATADSEVIYRETMKIFNHLKINPEDMRGVGIQMSKLIDVKENVSEPVGRLDTFLVKIRKADSPESEIIAGPSTEIKETTNDNSVDEAGPSCYKQLTFDESEYDITLSQVDGDYLAALPFNIKEEIVSRLRKRRKIDIRHVGTSRMKGELDDYYILEENGVRKLNPFIPSTEITKAISEWVFREQIPKEYDVRMLSDYLQQLILRKEFESVNFIVSHFQRSVTGVMQPEWKSAYQFVTNVIKEAMKSNYFNVFIKES